MSGREALVCGVALVCSISLMGWIVWTERPPVTTAPAPQTEATDVDAVGRPQETALDETRVAVLKATAEDMPDDVESRLALGDVYFEARRFEEAVPWYEVALALRPDHIDAGINLGVSYYYAGQIDLAVTQFERLLEVEPSNQRALLSLGIVKAFGLQDIEGASVLWQRAIDIAPNSPEGRAARDSLERMSAAHGVLEGAAPDVP